MVYPYAAPLESFPNMLTWEWWQGGWEQAAEPKIGASAWNIKAYLKPLPAEARSTPLSASLSAGVCRGLVLLHRHLSLPVMLWNIPPFQHCLSVGGVLMTSDDVEMRVCLWERMLKCGRHMPLLAALLKVAFSDVIFKFIFTDKYIFTVVCCNMMKLFHLVSSAIPRAVSSFSGMLHSWRRANCVFLFMWLNWFVSDIYAP